MNSTNTVVANAMAARNAAPKGLTPTTKLRLKEDFSDEYGSYRKGDVFPMYAMGGINPRFGTMMVPGRGVTLQIPWEKLEVVNATYKLSSAEAKVGDKVKVAGALGTYVVTKVDDEWIEIKDADDGTPQGRVEARFATPVKNAKRVARNATGYVNITSELDLIEAACVKAERAMELEGARISLKPIMDAYRKVRAQVADWWEDKKRREAL
jgi:hypothetical protein